MKLIALVRKYLGNFMDFSTTWFSILRYDHSVVYCVNKSSYYIALPLPPTYTQVLLSVSTTAPPQTVDCMNEKIRNIYGYRRPNAKLKQRVCAFDFAFTTRDTHEKVGSARKIRLREKRRGIGFETVAGMGGPPGYRRNPSSILAI